MRFKGTGRPLDDAGMDEVCARLGVADAQVWAVITVETRGFGFLPDRRPQILFERHVFHRRTGGVFSDAHPGVSNPRAGGYAGGPKEYTRLREAMRLDQVAALESASWGIAQVMGFNHAAAGYADVRAMVADMVAGETRQLLAMAGFLEGNGLVEALRRCNWSSFARGYNGADYKRNDYDTRLASAFARWQVRLPDLRLRAAQAALTYLGIDPGPVDGLRGRRTRAGLMTFQGEHDLAETGELDDDTEAHLLAQVFPAA